jgi:hypothetical protein
MLRFVRGGALPVFALALLFAIPAALRADDIILGNPSDVALCVPFGCDNFGPSTMYQQVYSATAFPQPTAIRSISFFNTESPTGSFLYSSYQISLSTTTAPVNGLSTNFDSNLGGDNQVFFNGILSGTANGQYTIYGSSFNYDPSQGNLLLDIRRTPLVLPGGIGSGGIAFNGRDNSNGLFSFMQNYLPSNFPNYGLVTEFSDTVPEPGTFLLIAGGFLAVGLIRHFRVS